MPRCKEGYFVSATYKHRKEDVEIRDGAQGGGRLS